MSKFLQKIKMTQYLNLLLEFKTVVNEFEELLKKFPQNRHEEIIFDKWSLKNIVSHLNHWMIHDINCLKNLIIEKEPFWESNVEEFNSKGVGVRKNKTWNEIYLEFITLKEKLTSLYANLPENLRHKKFWSDKNETPAEFLKEDILHWRDEHITSLKDFYNK